MLRIGARAALRCALALALAACAPAPGAISGLPPDSSFAGPFPVQITGYADHAMEPFVTRDGRYLLFNNRNAPPDSTDLHVASRVDDSTFRYVGPLATVNSATLDAVPTATADGTLYFVSLRAYAATSSTIFRAPLRGDSAGAAEPVVEVAPPGRGLLDFDVDVAADGASLVVARGRFTGGELPREADLQLYTRAGGRWRQAPADDSTFASINSGALEYAPAMSADGLALCFTRLERGGAPVLLLARRARITDPWGAPRRIVGPEGLAEAGTWSPDGRTLYFHAMVDGRYVIRRLTR